MTEKLGNAPYISTFLACFQSACPDLADAIVARDDTALLVISRPSLAAVISRSTSVFDAIDKNMELAEYISGLLVRGTEVHHITRLGVMRFS